jgi:hypothetical protein
MIQGNQRIDYDSLIEKYKHGLDLDNSWHREKVKGVREFVELIPPIPPASEKQTLIDFCAYLENNYSIRVSALCVEHYLQTKK